MNYSRIRLSELPEDVRAGLAPYTYDGPFNPQHLNLLQYMTPMAALVPGNPQR